MSLNIPFIGREKSRPPGLFYSFQRAAGSTARRRRENQKKRENKLAERNL
jgi:hypothetical protein